VVERQRAEGKVDYDPNRKMIFGFDTVPDSLRLAPYQGPAHGVSGAVSELQQNNPLYVEKQQDAGPSDERINVQPSTKKVWGAAKPEEAPPQKAAQSEQKTVAPSVSQPKQETNPVG